MFVYGFLGIVRGRVLRREWGICYVSGCFGFFVFSVFFIFVVVLKGSWNDFFFIVEKVEF